MPYLPPYVFTFELGQVAQAFDLPVFLSAPNDPIEPKCGTLVAYFTGIDSEEACIDLDVASIDSNIDN